MYIFKKIFTFARKTAVPKSGFSPPAGNRRHFRRSRQSSFFRHFRRPADFFVERAVKQIVAETVVIGGGGGEPGGKHNLCSLTHCRQQLPAAEILQPGHHRHSFAVTPFGGIDVDNVRIFDLPAAAFDVHPADAACISTGSKSCILRSWASISLSLSRRRPPFSVCAAAGKKENKTKKIAAANVFMALLRGRNFLIVLFKLFGAVV